MSYCENYHKRMAILKNFSSQSCQILYVDNTLLVNTRNDKIDVFQVHFTLIYYREEYRSEVNQNYVSDKRRE